LKGMVLITFTEGVAAISVGAYVLRRSDTFGGSAGLPSPPYQRGEGAGRPFGRPAPSES
jgi:hypothetical protein